jgi:hypothetical protein
MNEELEQAEITKRVFTDKRDFPLSTIRDMFSEGDIIPQPDYQRDYVMDDRRASKLVESLIMGIPIPTVYLCEENDGTYSVIDGQQRMTSFVRFLNNDFSLKGLEELTELNGKKFKDLDKTYQRTIKSSSLNSIILTKESQELKYEIFARLNQGSLRLKPQELRNCIYRGSFNNMLEEIAESNKLLPILFLEENKRKNYQEYILRFYALRNYLEYSTSMTKTMNDYMSKHQNDEEKEIENAKKLFNKTIDIVKQVFGDTAFCVYDRSKKDFVRKFSGPVYDSIIIACSYFDNHDLMVNSDEIRSQVLEVRKNNADYQDFTYAATGSKNRVIGRINMIYNIIANIIGKPADGDIKRIFTTDEKEELWNSSEKHICSYCGQEILDISDAEVDHINPYTNGGETELSNAQLLHRHCNREKSSKTTELDTVDFEDEEDNE